MSMPIASTTLAVNNLTNINGNANFNVQANKQLHHQAVDSPARSSMTATTAANSNSNSSRDDSTIVGLHYKIGKKIGEGSFGVLFEGTNMINGVPVAIKFEPRKTEAPQLRDEYKTYKILNGTPNIPYAYYFGQEGLHNILVIDLLGPSLEDLFDWCGRKFSVKTVVQVAVQMITLIEDLHAHDLIYRDIKPDNFLIGRPGQPDANNIHLIDFGMAKQYRDPKTKQHIPYREKKSLSGTARYMSINTHLGREQSRRDDMEALGHVFFYFLRGHLPWQGLKAPNNKQKYEKIGEKKRSTNVYDLAQGLPVQFGRYLEIVRSLSFEECPDYEGYRKLLLSVLDDLGETADGQYDWMKLNDGRGWDLNINKKPNLHGYGHPNPPNEKSRKHRNKQLQMQQLQQQQLQQQQQQQQYAQKTEADMRNSQYKPKLDPTSYEAYQHQTQQKYLQEQQKRQQQQKLQEQQLQEQQLQQQQQQQLRATGQPPSQPQAQTQSQQFGARYQPQKQPSAALRTPEQHPNDDNSSLAASHKGFFQKLGCC
ncbi:AVB_G0025110.mRNA.1.CDS.1 [Saccharomyces cerevisiae]|nr:Yck1p [Saccharomyces cerevisiae YJM1078]AJU26972.1 Yck1p [Saccharomyces cerevisiae YJM248]CAI4476229.1 AVB_G0025110.mRNA.1.CDS.1 [Saccharomyces cerevisiae]CAI4526715.1 AIE_G0024760.mRNA.1.CDS.1 [Saccharomyces cerevisiae]CAI6713923.1 AIE_G0024760.mRNA.1.CDS.1 [Saccharomyces cerevisiae]